jgi:hypothetical protein
MGHLVNAQFHRLNGKHILKFLIKTLNKLVYFQENGNRTKKPAMKISISREKFF